jgi:hypothetical protein
MEGEQDGEKTSKNKNISAGAIKTNKDTGFPRPFLPTLSSHKTMVNRYSPAFHAPIENHEEPSRFLG